MNTNITEPFYIGGKAIVEEVTNTIANIAKETSTILKRADAKWTDLGEVLKDNPLRVFVQRTTRRTVAPRAGGFRFHVIKTPAPVYLFTNGYDPDFKKKKQKREDDITMIKAQIEYGKLKEQAGTKLGHRRQ